MLKYVEELLEKPDRSAYTRQEVCEILAITDKELKQYSLNNNTQNSKFFRDAENFYIDLFHIFHTSFL